MVGKPIPKAEKERIHHIDFVVDTLHLRHQNVVESAEEAGNLQELLDQLSVQSGLPVKYLLPKNLNQEGYGSAVLREITVNTILKKINLLHQAPVNPFIWMSSQIPKSLFEKVLQNKFHFYIVGFFNPLRSYYNDLSG